MAKKQPRRSRVSDSASQDTGRSAGRGERDFNPDYSYVKKDLRRIGMLAGSFFVFLVVLSFFL